jgi:hypothetical protein
MHTVWRIMLAFFAAMMVGACATNSAADDDAIEPVAATTSESMSSTSTTTGGAADDATTTRPSPPVDLCPYRDMGVWVDVYDSVAAFAGPSPPVTPADIATMAREGVRTLYLQVAKDDPRAPGVVTDAALAAQFLRAAHAAGIRVVAWYLPTHANPAVDRERALALVHFEAEGERFDGVALDIEGVEAVVDVAERNRRLVALVEELDRAAGTMPVGAIVYPPVVFDVLNTELWPDFPWAEIAPHFDVWLPMSYWTHREGDSPYRDAYRYTTENVQRLRAHLGDPAAVVHVIGGIGDEATEADYSAFRRAAADEHTIGYSVYDFDTLSPAAWPLLRGQSTC